MILDAGVLVSIDRGERVAKTVARLAYDGSVPLHTSQAVVAQVWRDGARQARLARFLRSVAIHPLDDGREVGRVLRVSGTSDVVDAHLGLLAERWRDAILTGDVDDLTRVGSALTPPPAIIPWPPPPRNR
ncbi:MAG TPA: hypothetical protein VF228_21550 [Iamia sp.]